MLRSLAKCGALLSVLSGSSCAPTRPSGEASQAGFYSCVDVQALVSQVGKGLGSYAESTYFSEDEIVAIYPQRTFRRFADRLCLRDAGLPAYLASITRDSSPSGALWDSLFLDLCDQAACGKILLSDFARYVNPSTQATIEGFCSGPPQTAGLCFRASYQQALLRARLTLQKANTTDWQRELLRKRDQQGRRP